MHFLDDFLYISTNKNNVIKFITTMHQDDLKYKIVINDKKSMVNFDLTVNNNKINKVDGYGTYLLFYFILLIICFINCIVKY